MVKFRRAVVFNYRLIFSDFLADIPLHIVWQGVSVDLSQKIVLPYVFDLELCGRCNTVCSFCPRHEMKRGEDCMSQENFEFFITKILNYKQYLRNQSIYLPHEQVWANILDNEQTPLRVILCGMGESLLHRNCAEWISRIRQEVGIRVSLVTNGLLLKLKNIEKLARANVTVVLVSVPGIDKESYSQYMKLDWDLILGNIKQANQIMPGRIQINATIPDNATYSSQDILDFWAQWNIPVAGISSCHNRGGHLTDINLSGKNGKTTSHFCGIIARHNFIAWDGSILSCCHDLHAENKLGHISEDEFIDIAMRKTLSVEQGPTFRICKDCNDCERARPEQIISIGINRVTEQTHL